MIHGRLSPCLKAVFGLSPSLKAVFDCPLSSWGRYMTDVDGAVLPHVEATSGVRG